MKPVIFLFVLFFTLFFTFTVIAQDTIYVPADYSTIQQAINASSNGDLILVSDGLYYENINFRGKAITVASEYFIDGLETHIENTIINGSIPTYPDSGSVVTLKSGEDTTSVLCGFKITGGNGTILNVPGEGFRRIGGGILVYNSSAQIQNNIIEFNNINYSSDSWGGGIGAVSLASHNYVIENNIIRNNSINTPTIVYYSTGGGIYNLTQGYVRIVNNKILENTITAPIAYGGGIIPAGANNNNYFIINNIISGNIVNASSGGSGGIDVYNHNPVIKNNIIVSNSAPNGGGLVIESAQPVFINNTVAFNTATISGGGIDVIGMIPALMNCILWGNNAPTGPQIHGSADVQYSDVQGGFTGNGNINQNPEFITGSGFYILAGSSPCKDFGNPAAQYNDIEDPQSLGNAFWPALGTLRNDMGHFGGPTSLWCYWDWPIPVELTSFTASMSSSSVNLNWSTATETNNQGFEVERKQKNSSWKRIGFVEGHGTTTEPEDYSFVDNISDITSSSIAYRLKQIDFDGSFEYSDIVYVDNLTPTDFALYQNFPNPFNPTTTIEYSLPVKSQVELIVYNSLGEEIVELVNEVKEAGKYATEFNASYLPSGIYFYKLQVEDFVQTKKMILMK